MIIKKFAFGNATEAFVESRFSPNVNIIYTDTNNKGKTLVVQGIMYALGNEPAFPDAIDIKDYFFYLQISINTEVFEVLRKNNTFSIRQGNNLYTFDSVSELKYFINDNMFNMPKIEKGG